MDLGDKVPHPTHGGGEGRMELTSSFFFLNSLFDLSSKHTSSERTSCPKKSSETKAESLSFGAVGFATFMISDQ